MGCGTVVIVIEHLTGPWLFVGLVRVVEPRLWDVAKQFLFSSFAVPEFQKLVAVGDPVAPHRVGDIRR